MAVLVLGFTFIPKTEKGKRLIKYVVESKYVKVIEEAKKILKDKPEDIEIRNMLAMAYQMNAQLDEALSEVKIVLSKDNNNMDANQLLMNILHNRGDSDEAIKVAKKILNLDPNNTNAYYTLGVYYWNKYDREDLKKSIEYFTRVTELDPSREIVVSENLMNIYIELGEFKEAKMIGEKILNKNLISEHSSDYIVTHLDYVANITYYMSICYAQENNNSGALKFLQQAISLDNDLKDKAKEQKELFGEVSRLKEFEKIISN